MSLAERLSERVTQLEQRLANESTRTDELEVKWCIDNQGIKELMDQHLEGMARVDRLDKIVNDLVGAVFTLQCQAARDRAAAGLFMEILDTMIELVGSEDEIEKDVFTKLFNRVRQVGLMATNVAGGTPALT